MRFILLASALFAGAMARPGLLDPITNILSGAIPQIDVFTCGQERPYGLCCQQKDSTDGQYCEEASNRLSILGAAEFSCDKDYSNSPTMAFCCMDYKTGKEVYGAKGTNCEPMSPLGGTIARK